MQQLAAYLFSFDSLRGEFMTALVNFIVVAQTRTTKLLLYWVRLGTKHLKPYVMVCAIGYHLYNGKNIKTPMGKY